MVLSHFLLKSKVIYFYPYLRIYQLKKKCRDEKVTANIYIVLVCILLKKIEHNLELKLNTGSMPPRILLHYNLEMFTTANNSLSVFYDQDF